MNTTRIRSRKTGTGRSEWAGEDEPSRSTQVIVGHGGLVDCCGMTRIGSHRPDNQDNFAIRMLSSLQGRGPRGFFGVADGVGGGPAGGLASTIALRTAFRYLGEVLPTYTRPPGEGADVEGMLKRAIGDCQSAIEARCEEHPDEQGMATTLTLGCVLWPKLYLAHVGDSRAYLLRGSKLTRGTRDHSCAQALIDRRVFSADSPGALRWKNVIINLVGGRSRVVNPDVSRVDLGWGDVLLLCTDGLSDSLDDSRIAAILRKPVPAREICHRLVEEAQERRGTDDVTVVVARFGRPGLLRRVRDWINPS